MMEFVQGIRYGLVGIGCVFSFVVGLMVLAVFGSLLTALGDWLNNRTDEVEDEPEDEEEDDEE